MRIDSIDLFGPLYINGLVGSEGQIFGFSGSDVTWITASSSGTGTIGPQGSTGSSYPVESGEIVFSDPSGSGLTSSSIFSFDSLNNLIHHNGSPTLIANSSTILSASGGQIYNGTLVALLASKDSKICSGQYSVVAGGESNDLGCGLVNSTVRTSIIGGCLNYQIGGHIHSSIIGGTLNCLNCYSVQPLQMSTILGGKRNTIQSDASGYKYNTIIGGRLNCLIANSSTILGGYCNFINASNGLTSYTAILGGSHNYICAYSFGQPPPVGSVIIGGKSSTGVMGDRCVLMNTPHSVIIGGTDTKSAVEISNSGFYDNSLFVNCLRVDSHLKIRDYTPILPLESIFLPQGSFVNSSKSGGGNNYFYFNSGSVKNKVSFCPN